MNSQKQKRSRTYARNRAFSRKGNEKIYESDIAFFLKLTIIVLLGTVWLKFNQPFNLANIVLTALPIGTILGLFVVSKFERFQADRKIWYSVLLVITIISYFEDAGFVI